MQRKTIACAIACLFSLAGPALANPTGADIVSGTASLSSSGNTLTVTNSNNAIINWQSFNIGAGETTQFAQPSASSTVLNRVTGADASSIFGNLTSNGQVFLINPHGILFGADAQVNVGGLVASTLNISDTNFLAGDFQFSNGGSSGAPVNQGGVIHADSYIALFAPSIDMSGSMSTPGNILIGAANGVSLVMSRGQATNVTVNDFGNFDSAAHLLGSFEAGGSIIINVGGAVSLDGASLSGGTSSTAPASNVCLTTTGSCTSGGGSIQVISPTQLQVSQLSSSGTVSLAGGGSLSNGTSSIAPASNGCLTTTGSCTSGGGSIQITLPTQLQVGQLSSIAPVTVARPVRAVAAQLAPSAAHTPDVARGAATAGLMTLNLAKRDLSF
jgi:filamentous hemagglutinin family protein